MPIESVLYARQHARSQNARAALSKNPPRVWCLLLFAGACNALQQSHPKGLPESVRDRLLLGTDGLGIDFGRAQARVTEPLLQ